MQVDAANHSSIFSRFSLGEKVNVISTNQVMSRELTLNDKKNQLKA